MARLRLGEVLVQMGACTAANVEEALNNQVLYGGTVGTNLLEMGLITEQQLAVGLGRLHSLPFFSGEVKIDPAVARLIPKDLVERVEIVPLRLDDKKLLILVANPADVSAQDEVARASGMAVVPMVAAEERVWKLMKQTYGIEHLGRALAVPKPKPAAKKEAQAPVADLMSEDEFNALYSREKAPPTPFAAAAEEPLDEPVEELTELEPIADLPDAEIIEGEIVPEEVEPTFAPLTFGQASAALTDAHSRDVIAQIVLRYAASKFKRAVLLVFRGTVVDGWEGLGEGITSAKVRSLRIRLGVPGIFETVAKTNAHYLGPMLKTTENLRFLKTLAGGAPKNAFVIPILVRGRVVNALYADNGRGGSVDPEVGELLILASKIGQSYDALIARRA